MEENTIRRNIQGKKKKTRIINGHRRFLPLEKAELDMDKVSEMQSSEPPCSLYFLYIYCGGFLHYIFDTQRDIAVNFTK